MGPDGLCLDSAGNVIVAAAFGGLVLVYDPDGRLVEQMPVPDRLVTSVAFGGPDRRDLFITLTSTGHIMTVAWPVPGLPVPWQPPAGSR
jgi:gluconolactonase